VKHDEYELIMMMTRDMKTGRQVQWKQTKKNTLWQAWEIFTKQTFF